MKAYERFLDYVRVHTASAEDTEQTPTTACQFDLTHLLAGEMRALGMKDVYEDENAYVYGFIPATPG